MIKLSKVYKCFDKRVVLSDVSLSVSKNEFICITGESGAGKTTLLNLIGLLDKPDSGEISINEKNYFTSKEILKLRRNFFGYIFQDYLLMEDKTVQDNLNISKNIFKYENRRQDEKDINEILEMVRLNPAYLNKKVYQLSGGEQQKVAIARMLLKPYELVLADEPTGSVALVQHYPKIIPVMLLSRSTRISDMTERQSVRFSSRVRESYMLLKSACNILSTAEKSGGVSSGASSGICCRAAVYIW